MSARTHQRMRVVTEVEVPVGKILLAQFNHPGPAIHNFYQEDVYWLDLCLTPRRPAERARYVDRWVAHRFGNMGPLILLLPHYPLELHIAGGQRRSLICQIKKDAVTRWFPDDFEMTDRRLEASLNISSPEISSDMRRLAHELHHHAIGWEEAAAGVAKSVSVNLARYLVGVASADERGSLAAWRLRIIERSVARDGLPPSLPELADACRLSVRQLTRAFRLTRGCTIGEYLRQNRIEAAKRRLATGESVKSIADSLGFSSAANFSGTFRRITGHTPNGFRARVLRVGEIIPG